MLSVKQDSIKYHFLSFWYDSTWDWNQISRAIGEHSNHYANIWYERSNHCANNVIFSKNDFFVLWFGLENPLFCTAEINHIKGNNTGMDLS